MNLLRAIKAEVIKCKSSAVLRNSFIAFAIAPLMGAVFILMVRSPGALDKASAIHTKIEMLGFNGDWNAYFSLLMQAIGVGGVLIFGFVASWIFGREYSEGTAKDLMSLPISRATILNAKFVVYFIWSLCLSLSNLFLGLLIGLILKVSFPEPTIIPAQMFDYFITTLLTSLLGTVIAFFAVWGKGYLAPLGFVGLTLVIAQVIAAIGYGNYFPWSIPGLYSGSGGAYKDQLNVLSYLILAATTIVGYMTTVFYWKLADHSK